MGRIRLSESQLLGMMQNSVERLVKEYAYHERQHKPSPEEHEAWIKKMSAAKKAYYDSLQKDKGDNGKEKSKYIDYYQYKHGEHPVMNLKEANTIVGHNISNKIENMGKDIVKLNESQLKSIVAESVKRVINEIGDTFAGRNAMSKVASRAANAELPSASWDPRGFSKGMKRAKDTRSSLEGAYNNEYDGGASYKGGSTTFKYGMDSGAVKAFSLDPSTGEFKCIAGAGNIVPLEKAMNSSVFKTDENTAQAIAKWLGEMSRMHGADVPAEATDWHTWCDNRGAQLEKVVAESVKKVLAEINGTGRNYATVKAAYDKMRDLGQNVRANQLKNTFNDLSDDPNSDVVAYYPFSDTDAVKFHRRDKFGDSLRTDGTKRPASSYTSADGYEPFETYRGFDDSTKGGERYDDPKAINDMLKHIKNVKPDTRFTKNDFRA